MSTTCLRNSTCSCLQDLRDDVSATRDDVLNTLRNRGEREKMTKNLQLLKSGVLISLEGVLKKLDQLLLNKSAPIWTTVGK